MIYCVEDDDNIRELVIYTLETTREDRWLPDLWGISSVGRAPALQAGGHEFESRILHLIMNLHYHLCTLKIAYKK